MILTRRLPIQFVILLGMRIAAIAVRCMAFHTPEIDHPLHGTLAAETTERENDAELTEAALSFARFVRPFVASSPWGVRHAAVVRALQVAEGAIQTSI